MVGRAVMMIVLVQPPAVAESENKVRVHQAYRFIQRRAAENFLMAGVVHNEPQLREYERQKSGVANFDPGILKPRDQQESADEHHHVEKNFSEVVRGLLGQ